MTNASRMDNFHNAALRAAKGGNWNLRWKLFQSEIKRVRKRDKLYVQVLRKNENTEDLYDVVVFWTGAFDYKPMGPEHKAYALSKNAEAPKTICFAEKLYLETWRAIMRNRR